MKKITALLMAACMLLGVCGCGKKTSKEESAIPTLRWFVPGEAQPDLEKVLEKVNEITVQKIGAKLQIQFIPTGSYSERMKMNMASGLEYDLCFTSNWLNYYDEAARNDAFYDLTEFIDDEIKTVVPEDIFENVKIDGKIYAVPNMQIMAQPLAVKARKDMLEKYNFDLQAIKTIDDIEPFLELIKQNEPSLYPYRTRWGVNPWTLAQWSELAASSLFFNNTTYEMKPMWEVDEYKHAVNQLRAWYKKGYIRADVDSMGDDTTADKQGKYAVKIDSWKPGADAEEAKKAIPYEFKIIVPARKEGNSGRSTMTAIGIKSKYPEKAFAFIKLINTDVELYNLICNGIEGVHYTFDEDHKLVQKDKSGYAPNSDWEFGNQFNAYIKQGMDDDVWEQTKRLNEEALPNPLAGFNLDKSKIKLDLANIVAINSEYSGWITVQDYDKWLKEYISKLEEAGMDKVYKEIERQVNEFLKNK